ncbi:MAG: alpha/beta hydrolase fold domain-containing protein [Mucilaginibacter sp.]
MKRPLLLVCVYFSLLCFNVSAQTNPVKGIFPQGTVMYGNIPYANDTLKKHLLDIYLPATGKSNYPVVIWVHGGAWMSNDKYADMGYMVNTVKSFIDSGYAVASIDYRWSTAAKFPAQIQDCNQAIEFLYQNAGQYKLDRNKLAIIGFSAGGHLASLLALSNNNMVPAFYPAGKKPHFKIKLALDFYGPSDLVALSANTPSSEEDLKDPITLLLGAWPIDRPDLAKTASPITYVDKNDPPFLIVQGQKDQSVNYTQSVLLSAYLKLSGVKNELIIVPGAPHYGVMFDAENIRKKVFLFLDNYLR